MKTDAPSTVTPHLLTEISAEDALAAGELIAATWPRPDRGAPERADQLMRMGREYSGPVELAPRSMMVHDASCVIAHAMVFPRKILIDPWEPTVLALAMVTSDHRQRGRGLGAMVVKAAFELVDQGVFPCCLFQTSEGVENFYERLGCARVENRVVNSHNHDEPDANPFWDDLVMRYPGSAGWPEGTIDLRGPGY